MCEEKATSGANSMQLYTSTIKEGRSAKLTKHGPANTVEAFSGPHPWRGPEEVKLGLSYWN